MKLLTVISLVFLSINLYGQDYYFINAEGGLNVRSDSNLSSKKIAKIPFGMIIEKIADTDKELVINDNGKQVKGKFVKIKYNNYPYLVTRATDASELEGYVFDGYLKKVNNVDLITVKQIDEVRYRKLSQKASKKIRKSKAIRNLDSIKTILKHRVAWATESERDDVIKSITTENGQKLIFNQNSYDFGFSKGYSGYYREYDILVLEGGHSSDVCFSIKTGETELTIGNPEYMIATPRNTYRLNGYFGGQECISYFFQKNENDKFVYLTDFYSDFDICTFKTFYWISETSFIYTTINYRTDSENGTEDYFMGVINENE